MSDFGDRRWSERQGSGLSLVRLVFGAALALFFVWLGGLIAFAEGLPRAVEQVGRKTDAIVVLTGGAERLKAGVQLLVEGGARKMLISGVDPATTAAMLQIGGAPEAELFRCCVDLGYEARNTEGNAIETALWVRRDGYRSLRLVTASYHMPRSLLLFRQAMPGVEMVANPVFPEHVKQEHWWLYPGTARLFAMEYSKYVVSLIRVRLTGDSAD